MMSPELLKVSLRQRALYLPHVTPRQGGCLKGSTLAVVAELRELGFTLSEEALHAFDSLSDTGQQEVLCVVNEVMGTDLNWASLVKGWLVPTGETLWNHFVTFVANWMDSEMAAEGTRLPCGHLIPSGTFPLERYNGCPFCGTPFHTDNNIPKGQGTALRTLQLWGRDDLEAFFRDLLLSPVSLDATQCESLKTLLHHLPLPSTLHQWHSTIQKETLILVVDELVTMGRDEEAGALFLSPTDVLRYLWYRHTGQIQLLQPHTLLNIEKKNHRYEWNTEEDIARHLTERKTELKLKYSRPWCRRVARWMNRLPMPIDQQLETMHPKREMWVRFIRALRLAEYARHAGYGQLATLLDRFYRQDYVVWQGMVDRSRLSGDAQDTLRLLRQRPGLFARCLFSTMLRLGERSVIEAFRQVISAVPVRLLLTLGSQADLYFDPSQLRVVRPLSGVMKSIPPHPLLNAYTSDELEHMRQSVRQLYLEAMRMKFAAQDADGTPRRVFIDPQLYHIPVSVGDRSATIQDVSAALQGTRFPVRGDHVRLFLQWGKDLPAQHLDMDLSCYILTEKESELCAYFNLAPQGAKHSGDIQYIPDFVGTAEYIELSLPDLEARGARQVVFTCNAYTEGSLQPNLMVGWMSAEQPMTVSEETGVAYDPSTVDHLVRISEGNLSKGLIFGVLDVSRREIIWLEMPFDGQTVLSVDPQTIGSYLRRLQAKPTIGQVLALRAEALRQTIVLSPDEADEQFTTFWAQNTAKVSRLLLS